MKLLDIIKYGDRKLDSLELASGAFEYYCYVHYQHEHNGKSYTYYYYYAGSYPDMWGTLDILLEWCEGNTWYVIRKIIKVPPALAMYYNLLLT